MVGQTGQRLEQTTESVEWHAGLFQVVEVQFLAAAFQRRFESTQYRVDIRLWKLAEDKQIAFTFTAGKTTKTIYTGFWLDMTLTAYTE